MSSRIKAQNWSLLPEVGLMACTAPSLILTGKCAWAKFPEMWGKFSTSNKTKRLLRELK